MVNTVITDLDGTLLDKNHDINDKTIETLNRLNSIGVKIILATGRNYADAVRIRNKLNFIPPLITSNGAELTDINDKLVYKTLLDSTIVEKLINMNYKKYSNDIYINFVEQDNWVGIEEYPKGCKILEWEDETWKFNVKKVESLNKNDVLKVFFIAEHEVLVKLLEDTKKLLGDSVNYAFTLPFCLEIFPNTVDKANALKELDKIDEIDFKNSIAFGDGFNDVKMLNLANKAYIMGNAPKALKDFVTNAEIIKPNYENGLLEKLVEIFGEK